MKRKLSGSISEKLLSSSDATEFFSNYADTFSDFFMRLNIEYAEYTKKCQTSLKELIDQLFLDNDKWKLYVDYTRKIENFKDLMS